MVNIITKTKCLKFLAILGFFIFASVSSAHAVTLSQTCYPFVNKITSIKNNPSCLLIDATSTCSESVFIHSDCSFDFDLYINGVKENEILTNESQYIKLQHNESPRYSFDWTPNVFECEDTHGFKVIEITPTPSRYPSCDTMAKLYDNKPRGTIVKNWVLKLVPQNGGKDIEITGYTQYDKTNARIIGGPPSPAFMIVFDVISFLPFIGVVIYIIRRIFLKKKITFLLVLLGIGCLISGYFLDFIARFSF